MKTSPKQQGCRFLKSTADTILSSWWQPIGLMIAASFLYRTVPYHITPPQTRLNGRQA
jgi:hypothetical protein